MYQKVEEAKIMALLQNGYRNGWDFLEERYLTFQARRRSGELI
jgi:hypothetical protein